MMGEEVWNFEEREKDMTIIYGRRRMNELWEYSLIIRQHGRSTWTYDCEFGEISPCGYTAMFSCMGKVSLEEHEGDYWRIIFVSN